MLMRSAAISSGHRRRSGKLHQNLHSEFLLPNRAMAVGNETRSCSETQLTSLQHAILRICETNKFHRALKSKASRKHTKEYSKARARYPSPEN
jgi:hypothetical protein